MAKSTGLKEIKKRDGSMVSFDETRIITAVGKAMKASGEGEERDAGVVATSVVKDLIKLVKKSGKSYVPSVEEVQDLVEKQLVAHNFAKVAKAYILYRERRAEVRREKGEVPKEVKELATDSKKYFRNQLSEFVYYTTYSKWIPDKNRRETWLETVGRYLDFMQENLGSKLKEKEYNEIREYMLGMRALGSMSRNSPTLVPVLGKQRGRAMSALTIVLSSRRASGKTSPK